MHVQEIMHCCWVFDLWPFFRQREAAPNEQHIYLCFLAGEEHQSVLRGEQFEFGLNAAVSHAHPG